LCSKLTFKGERCGSIFEELAWLEIHRRVNDASRRFVSMAQDLGQMGQQAKEKIGSAAGQLLGGNQTGNQTGNQSGGALGQLGEQAKSMLPGQ